MRDKKQKGTIRITVDVTPDFYQAFEKLAEMVDSPIKANIIRDALRSYQYIASRQRAGCKFEVTYPSGEKENPVFPGVPPPAA